MSLKRNMAVIWRSTGDLSPHPNNPRTHSASQLEQIYASVARFGWVCPLIVDEELTILAGHGRWEMAEANHIDEVPTIQITGLNEDEKRAYLLADNRLSENSDWDVARLIQEIDYLASVNIEADTLGFSDADILAYHSSIDDVEFTEPLDLAPQIRPSLDSSPTRIESSTEPTLLQSDNKEYVPQDLSALEAATLVPFSVMLPADDRERVMSVLQGVGDYSIAEALMVVIDAFDADSRDNEESEGEQE